MINTDKKPKAVTLLEMLISIFIFALVSASVSLVFNRSLFVYRGSTDKNIAAQEAQTATEWILRDIRSAYAIVVAQANNISLINPQQSYIRYYLDPVNKTIQRQECADQSYLLAENVTQFSLKYYDINNNIIADPVTNILSLKTVEIDITTSRNRQEFRLNTVARFEYDPKCAWVKAYGGTTTDTFDSLQQTSDGYIVGGYTESFGAGGADALLIKTNASGNLQWAKTYGGSGYDYLYSLQQTSDDGYILGGRTRSFGLSNYEVLLIKTDASGNLQWAKTYGGTDYDSLFSLQQTSDDGYILGGRTLSFGAGGYDDFLLIKTDASGNLQWAKTYGDSNYDYFYSLQQTSDGYILGGSTFSFGAGWQDVFVIKTDASGTLQWAKTYGGSGYDYLFSLQQTSDDGYILGGKTECFGAAIYDFLLIKTNASGNLQWAKTYGGADYDYLYSLQQTSDDGYIFGGRTLSFGASNYDFALVKTDVSGNLQWARTYGGADYDSLLSLQQTSDNGYILGGDTLSFGAGGNDFLLIKADSLGDLGCCIPITTFAYSNDGNPANDDFTPTVRSHGTDFTVTTKSHSTDFTVTTKSHGTDFTVTTKSHGTDFTVTTKSHGTNFTLTTTPICPSP